MTAEAERRRSRPASVSRGHRMIVRWVELDALVHLLRDRRFQERLVTGVIAVAALGHMAGQGRASLLTRLVAWDKRLARRLKVAAAQRPR